MDLLLIVIALVIVGYIVFVVAFPKAVPDEPSKHTRGVLQQMMEEGQPEAEDKDTSILTNYYEEENALVRGFFALPPLNSLYPKLVQAGLHRSAMVFAVAMIGLLCALTGLLIFIGLGLPAVVIAPVLTFLLAKFYIEKRVQKRNEAFINQFPDVLDMFVRSVKSGFPVTTALKMVAENMEEPVRSEFQQVVNELSLGQTLSYSLTRLSQRINEPDIHFFVVVMKVQQETGGNLAEVVSNLSNVIRKRKQLRMKIKAMTSEGRVTSYILGALPVVVFAALFFIRRDYLEILWTTTPGMIVLGTSVGLIIACMVVVNQMVKIDI